MNLNFFEKNWRLYSDVKNLIMSPFQKYRFKKDLKVWNNFGPRYFYARNFFSKRIAKELNYKIIRVWNNSQTRVNSETRVNNKLKIIGFTSIEGKYQVFFLNPTHVAHLDISDQKQKLSVFRL